MPRNWPAFGKNHRPGKVAGAAEQFSINKVADAAEAEPDRRGRGAKVGDRPKIPALLAADVPGGQDHADEAAVERHAALPDGEDREWIASIGRQVVEQDVTDAAADHDAQNQ